MSAQPHKAPEEARRRDRPRPRPARLRDRLIRILRRGSDRRREAQLRANPHLARDVGLIPDDPDKWSTS